MSTRRSKGRRPRVRGANDGDVVYRLVFTKDRLLRRGRRRSSGAGPMARMFERGNRAGGP